MTEPTSSYDVGYGKPPREHQWGAGQSGNPAGRPRKKRKPATFVDGVVLALLEEHRVTIDGAEKKMSAYEIVCQGLVRDLLKAQGRERLAIIRCLEAMGAFEQLRWALEEMHREPQVFTNDDLKFLACLDRRIEEAKQLDPDAWAYDARPDRAGRL